MPETDAAWLLPALAFAAGAGLAALACWGFVRRAVRRQTAELRECEARLAARQENAQPPVGGSVLEVTEARQAEQERQQLEERLRQAHITEEIRFLTARVAHGFRNLLGTIPGYCDLALDGLPADSQSRADIEAIRTHAERALLLVKQVLTPGDDRRPEPPRTDLNTWVAEVGARLANALPAGIAVDYRLAANAAEVRADPRQLEQAFTNLVLNARDAMPQGGTLTIETAAIVDDRQHAGIHGETRLGPHVMLAITDTGKGMDAATLSRVFVPFVTTKGRGNGAGLGLFTACSIVRLYGGIVTAESAPGRGSTFRICLPSAVGSPTAAASADCPVRAGQFTGQTILVVEDEESVCRFVRTSLAQAGYEVMDAADGAEALGKAAAYPGTIDLLLTDVVMPGMNGKELYDRLVSLRPGLPVLYMSGYTQDVIARHGILEQGTHLLSKPFSVPDLTAKVREVLMASWQPVEIRVS